MRSFVQKGRPVSEPTLTPAVVIGTGLVGASVGAALVKAGVEVHLIDRLSSHAKVAASRDARHRPHRPGHGPAGRRRRPAGTARRHHRERLAHTRRRPSPTSVR